MTKHKTHVTELSPLRSRQPAHVILSNLLQNVFRKTPETIIVAVGGPGGTGKSTFCKALSETLQDSCLIRLDDYKTPRTERQHNNLFGAHPNANKMTLIRQHLEQLKNGKSINKPIYNSVTGQADEEITVEPANFTILDGEISTYSDFRDMVDFAVFIDSDWTTQLNTRTSRDIQERGYSQEKAINTFLQSNLREFATYGAESKQWADVHLYAHIDYHLEIESINSELFQHFHEILDNHVKAIDMSGLVVAVTTPFSKDEQIDSRAFVEHLEFLADKGVKRILVNGTTGEFFSLKPDERKMLLTLARRYFPGVIIFQAGSDSLALTMEELKWADKYGADAVAVLPPYYFCNAPEIGLTKYFQKISNTTDLPLILYNFPLHTQTPITKELLQKVPHFGLKNSSADLALIDHTPHYYQGDEDLFLESQKRGCYGFVSGLANVYPELFTKLERALKNGDTKLAEETQAQITQTREDFNSPLIPNVKKLLAESLPDYPPHVRLPLLNA